MARKRDPKRNQAYQLWLDSDRKITNRAIAEKLDVPEKTISAWKSRDKWNVVLQSDERSTANDKRSTTNKRGAPKGNKNALGNQGGAPSRNSNASTHGFFKTIFPDDEETLDIIDNISLKSPLEMLWENIIIQYTAIARAQKIMYVNDKYDMTKELSSESNTDMGNSESYDIQFAHDKHANFLAAQSRAMTNLQNMIKQYEKMCNTDEQRLRVDKLEAETKLLQNQLKESDQSNENVIIVNGDDEMREFLNEDSHKDN